MASHSSLVPVKQRLASSGVRLILVSILTAASPEISCGSFGIFITPFSKASEYPNLWAEEAPQLVLLALFGSRAQ